MKNTDLINRLDKISNDLNKVSDELYEKRNAHDYINVDDAIYIVGSYLNDFWEEMDEIIAELKGETK